MKEYDSMGENMELGKVSLIMPVYNAEKYIDQAIESILNQTYVNFELILIDDVSTDSTRQRLNTYLDDRIRIVHNVKNMGIAYSRNRGLDIAKGEYIALMDDDDIAAAQRLEKQVDFLMKHPEVDFVGGRYQLIDEFGKVLYEEKKAYYNPMYIKAMFLFQNIYSNGEMLFRKKVIDDNRIRYSENQLGMEDFKFWIECSKVGKFCTIDELFLQHRVHEQSETYRNKRNWFEERENQRAKLQKYSMQLSNLFLADQDFKVINQFTNKDVCNSIEDLEKYYYALKKLIDQAQDIDLDFVEELEILCKKYISKQIRQMKEFWKG